MWQQRLCCRSCSYPARQLWIWTSNFFISQKLTDTQRRWATIEKEAYAIVWALTKLKEVIIDSKIHIFTYHNSLTYLTESMSKSAKLVRWSLALQTFDVDVKYTKGKLNVVADCLSRLQICVVIRWLKYSCNWNFRLCIIMFNV